MRLVALGSSFAAGPGIPPVVDRPQRPRRLTRPLLRLAPQLDGLPAHALPPQLPGMAAVADAIAATLGS